MLHEPLFSTAITHKCTPPMPYTGRRLAPSPCKSYKEASFPSTQFSNTQISFSATELSLRWKETNIVIHIYTTLFFFSLPI
jgi:hypothetical protein